MSAPLHVIDTHCHIHDSEFAARYDQTPDELITDADKVGVKQFICVGTDLKSSEEAMSFCESRDNCYPSLALHPHEAENLSEDEIDHQMSILDRLMDKRAVAIGECGLDYYYHDDENVRRKQKFLLERHLLLAQKYKLPLIFHVRNQKVLVDCEKSAFDDFFELLDKHDNPHGVVHSFTVTSKELEGAITRGLFIGLNGIMTFSNDKEQLAAAKQVPQSKLILETDAPFLTPKPFRGKMCKPEHIMLTAKFLAELRGESLEEIAANTTRNAKQLFGI